MGRHLTGWVFGVGVLIGAGLMSVSPAQAFCVLNSTNENLDMFAGQCSDCVRETLKPDESVCCPADEQRCMDKIVTFKRTDEQDALAWSDCGAPTPPSGWVLLEDGGPDLGGDEDRFGLSCRVMNERGEKISDKLVSPSHTCPNPSFAPATC